MGTIWTDHTLDKWVTHYRLQCINSGGYGMVLGQRSVRFAHPRTQPIRITFPEEAK